MTELAPFAIPQGLIIPPYKLEILYGLLKCSQNVTDAHREFWYNLLPLLHKQGDE